MKDTFYFSHDYNARNDEKILELRSEFGAEGYGIYWMIIESMAESSECSININLIAGLSLSYGIAKAKLNDVIKFCLDISLLEQVDDSIYSKRLNEHKNFRKGRSDAGKLGAEKRWKNADKNSYAIANEWHSHSNTNAKERKGKERKEKEIKDNNPLPPKGGMDSKLNFLFVEAEFAKCFYDWIEYKKQKNQSYKSQKSLEACYELLKKKSGNSPDVAEQIVKQSLANNWAGLFELKQESNGITRINNRTANANELAELARRSGEFLRAVNGQDL